MIKNIPAKNIRWDRYVAKWDDQDWTQCVMCPASWIGSDPFLAKGWFDVDCHGPTSTNKPNMLDALQEFFDLPERHIVSLFYPGTILEDQILHKGMFLSLLDEIIEMYED
jgi:hypothetical protein